MTVPAPWSHSSLDDFVNCPRAYYEKRVVKSVKEAQSEQMIWGELVHKHFEDRQAKGTPLPDDLAHHEVVMAWLQQLGGAAHTERKVALSKQLAPCGFFDAEVWFRGIIDYTKISGSRALIIDYKTGKQHSKYQQLKLFALHTFAQYPEVDQVKVSFYWTQTGKSTGETYTRDQIASLWAEFIPNLKQYAQAFKEDIWQPRQSGLCKAHCPVTQCEFNGKTNGQFRRR